MNAGYPGDIERDTTMRKVKQMAVGPEIYGLLERARMTEADRQRALEIIRIAEGFADAIVWAREKVAAIGTWFLKPSMKH